MTLTTTHEGLRLQPRCVIVECEEIYPSWSEKERLVMKEELRRHSMLVARTF